MKRRPYDNPGSLAWDMALSAADAVIDRANLNCPTLRDVRKLATGVLAMRFLPAAGLFVAAGRTDFRVVDEDAAELDPVYAEWARDVVRVVVADLELAT